MNVTLSNLNPHGTVAAIPSKSHAHRLLIAAALSDSELSIRCERSNDDIDATARCLNAMCADIRYENGIFFVKPIKNPPKDVILDVGESGSTLRFLLPVAAALGMTAHFRMKGRLSERPLSPLREEMIAHGVAFGDVGSNPLTISCKMRGGRFTFDGGISSQFTTGLLLAMSKLDEPSSVTLTGKIESRPYIDLTIATLRSLGVQVTATDDTFAVTGRTPCEADIINAEGDWSNAAFMLALGAMSEEGVTVTGLDMKSTQGDKRIINLLDSFGVSLTCIGQNITSRRSKMTGVPEIDVADIPDLVPIISVISSAAVGTTVIKNCARLRLKESDRIASVCAMINNLGGHAKSIGDDIIIEGTGKLSGGTVDSYNDHRIAMSAAVAAVICKNPVTIVGAEAVRKSYPAFFDDLGVLCGQKFTFDNKPEGEKI